MHKFEKQFQVWTNYGLENWVISSEWDTIEDALLKGTDTCGMEWAITSRVELSIKEK